VQHNVPEDDIHYLTSFRQQLRGLMFGTTFAYGEPPNAMIRNEMQRMHQELEAHLGDFNSLLKSDVANYNKAAYQAGAPTLLTGGPIHIEAVSL